MFGSGKKKDINRKYQECQQKKGILLDVRTAEEYRDGHLPGSFNLPLDQIENIDKNFPSKKEHYYVYCRSGMRAQQAVIIMQQMGYENCENIGGILDYTGETEQ